MNLVVVVCDDDSARRALETLAEMGARHPARTVVFVLEPDARDKPRQLKAKATLYGSFISGHPVCTDIVELHPYGPMVDHLDSLVEPLELVDVPTAVWYFETSPVAHDALLSASHAVIVDTKELGAQFALDAVADVSQQHTVIDLSWLRLTAWRELLANLFEGHMLRPFLDNVTAVEVSGKAAPRRLLSGWLMAQLNLQPKQIIVEDAQHVTIKISGQYEGKLGEFVVTREVDRRVVHAIVTINGEIFFEEYVALSDHPLSYSITQALIHLTPNHIFELALHTGLRLEAA